MMGLTLPPTWSAALVLLLATGAGGYWAGDHNRNNAWLARMLVQERASAQALQAEMARALGVQQAAQRQQQALQDSYATLEGKFNEFKQRGPLVVVRDRGGVAAGAVAAGTVAAAAPGAPAPGAAGPALAGAADAGVGLSLGAVWVWNSALLGADTPAGACSAADTASAACATDSGLGVADAWANHSANAASCALDRLRQQQLIDYLSSTP